MKKEILEKKLNKEYEHIGVISIKEMYEDNIDISEIKYVEEIMDKINPLDIDKPIVLAKDEYSDYQIIDGYHRLKNKLLKREKLVKSIILDKYKITRKNGSGGDRFFDFLERLVGQKIKFIDNNILLVEVDNNYYYIKGNEGCGGCSNGWSHILISPEFIGKEITIKSLRGVSEDRESDLYDLFINDEKVAEVDTGWGNGYYGGDFEIILIS